VSTRGYVVALHRGDTRLLVSADRMPHGGTR
jgi:hypothetical protein